MENGITTKQPSRLSTIDLEVISDGEPQKIEADLTRFNKAKEQVALTITELNRFLNIYTRENLNDAMETLRIASKVEKAIENKRKDLVKPFNDCSNAINDHARTIINGLPKAIANVKSACIKFQKDEEEKAAKMKFEARKQQLAAMGLAFDKESNKYVLEEVSLAAVLVEVNDIAWIKIVAELSEHLKVQASNKIAALENQKDDYDLLGLDDESEAVTQSIETIQHRSINRTAGNIEAFMPMAPAKLAGSAKIWKFKITDRSKVPSEYLIVDEMLIRRAISAGKREIPGVEIFQEDQLRIK